MLLIIIICSREKAIKNEEHVVQLGGAHHHNNEVAGSSHATNRGNKREKKVAKYLKTCSSIYIITIKAAQYQGYVIAPQSSISLQNTSLQVALVNLKCFPLYSFS